MNLEWEIVDCRARTPGGCYYITLARDPRWPKGFVYLARWCADGGTDGSYPGTCLSRDAGLGGSEDLGIVKLMCEKDAKRF